MISFIWPAGEAMVAGAGGSETFTAGHVRDLLRQGVAAQVVIADINLLASRDDFPDIPFLGFSNEREISQLDGSVVFVNRAYDVPTKTKATILLHCVVPSKLDRKARMRDVQGKNILATSIYNAQQWALYLGVPSGDIRVVMPFADPAFGNVVRASASEKTRVLYAGRLHPEKGIYTILEMLHYRDAKRLNMEMTIVMAGQHVETGKVIASMLKSYPYARLVDPVKDVASMAALLSETDILLMPSVFEEPFGMLSVEAQHTGCRVIASSLGGLPETNCGLLTLVEQRNPVALIAGIKAAIQLGAATDEQRTRATTHFTLGKSVAELLALL